jgi:hydroxyacylglutathione hydrolase
MLNIKMFTFSPVQENTYVVYNEEKECCIIDPGCYTYNERKQLKEFISDFGLAPKYLLNTHCHLDHIFGNSFVHDTYGLTLHLHEKEKQVLDFGPTSGIMWGLPFENYEGELVYVAETDTIELGRDRFSILFTPGHSPGSICFYCEEQRFIISGDVLFNQSIGRTDLPGGNYNTLLNSIKTKLWPLPDDVVVHSGHGPSTTIGFEKKNNPFVGERGYPA